MGELGHCFSSLTIRHVPLIFMVENCNVKRSILYFFQGLTYLVCTSLSIMVCHRLWRSIYKRPEELVGMGDRAGPLYCIMEMLTKVVLYLMHAKSMQN